MFFLLALYPFGYAIDMIFNKFDGLLWIDEQRLVFFLISCPLVILILLYECFPVEITKKTSAVICTILFCISVILRLFCSALLQVSVVSDFKDCFDYAANGYMGRIDYLAKYPYLGAYALTLRDFFRWYSPSLLNVQILNAVITSVIPIFLFLGTRRVFGKTNVAVLAGASYVIFPSMIVYAAVPSCEHFSQLYMAAFLCAMAFFCTEKKLAKRYIFACLAGLACGWLCVYKELMIIIAPTCIMASFCYEILPCICKSMKDKKFDYKRMFHFILLDLFIIVLALSLSKNIIGEVQNELVGRTVDRNEPLSVSVYEGLCKEGAGLFNDDVKLYIEQLLEQNPNSNDVNRILYSKLISDYKNNLSDLFQLIQKKFAINWCDEGVYYYWTFGDEGNLVQSTWIGEILFSTIPSLWFMVMSAVICLGSILSLVRKDTVEQQYFDFLATGTVFLLSAGLILMEAQGRYKSNLSPQLCIMFALCMDRILGYLSLLRKTDTLKRKKVFMYLAYLFNSPKPLR